LKTCSTKGALRRTNCDSCGGGQQWCENENSWVKLNTGKEDTTTRGADLQTWNLDVLTAHKKKKEGESF